jgi:hypothetical protein
MVCQWLFKYANKYPPKTADTENKCFVRCHETLCLCAAAGPAPMQTLPPVSCFEAMLLDEHQSLNCWHTFRTLSKSYND